MILVLLGLWLLGWDGYHLPDPRLTPGEIRLTNSAEVCATAWGKDVRHVTPAMKREVCQRYGATQCPGPKWEIDHLIPRELGGADTIKNLWPQHIAEARLKDHLENFLHRAVCGGAMSLEDAQHTIREDWTQAWRQMKEQP